MPWEHWKHVFFFTETTCVFVSKASSEPLGGSMAWPFDWASFLMRKMMAINLFGTVCAKF